MKLLSLALMVLLPFIHGCNMTASKPIADDPDYAPIIPEPIKQQVMATGSLLMLG